MSGDMLEEMAAFLDERLAADEMAATRAGHEVAVTMIRHADSMRAVVDVARVTRGSEREALEAAVRVIVSAYNDAPGYKSAWLPSRSAWAERLRRQKVTGTKAAGRNLVSLEEAAAHMGVNQKTVRRRISDGSLPAYRMGPRLMRVDMADVERLLAPIPTVGMWT